MTLPRLATLHVRSRAIGRALVWLLAMAVLAGLALAGDEAPATRPMVLLFVPLLAAGMVIAALVSPFGETDATIGDRLARLRAAQTAGLVATGSMLFVAADLSGGMGWALARNLVGYAGLALVGAYFLGVHWFWLPPVLFAGFVGATCLIAVDPNPWAMWPVVAATNGIAWLVVTACLMAGLTLILSRGPRESPLASSFATG